MIKANQRFFTRLNMLIDSLIAFACMLIAYWIRFFILPNAQESYDPILFVIMAGISAVLHMIVFSLVGLYRTNRNNRFYVIIMQIFFAETICLLVILSALYMLELADVSRIVIFISYLLGFGVTAAKHIVIRLVLRHYRRKGYNLKHVVIIGSGHTAENYAAMVESHRELGYSIVGYYAQEDVWQPYEWIGNFEKIEGTAKTINPDEAIIALKPEDYIHIKNIIRICDKIGVPIRIIPCYDDYVSSQMAMEMVEGINIMDIRLVPLSKASNALIKRTMDIVLSILVLIITSPVLLIAAIGIKITSPGPILFRQERVGKDKKDFQMLKLRSMRINDKADTAWTKKGDKRKTVFGSLLRKCSIDELPQFVNILRGDMSVVGPRPEIPFHVERFADDIPLYMIKHYVRPGITGWAQVNGYRGDTSIRKRIEHDIYYIENWTIWLDLKIMFLTMFHLVNDEEIPTAREKKPPRKARGR